MGGAFLAKHLPSFLADRVNVLTLAVTKITLT
jgi:hypothetical protein